jgi:membrane dipeptidase
MQSYQNLHDDAIVVDGLIISDWNERVFEDMRRGGITAANCTCSVWEDFNGTMANIAQWKAWFEQHADIIRQVHSTGDIKAAKTEGRVGIILGWQNTSGIEDKLSNLRLFRDLGVRVMQLTYNTQNLVGSGCMESRDGGLSDFGRDLIEEMNRCGILVDLSHVGPKTSDEAIRHSKKPVAFTHCAPHSLLTHPRNKTDDAFRLIAEHGGFVGVTTYPPFLSRDASASLDDALTAIEHAINVVGEEAVGIGTDFTQGQSAEWFDWLCHDKGAGRLIFRRDWDTAPFPKDLSSLADFPNLTQAMIRRGWKETRIRKILGENWLRLLREAWGE